MLHLDNWSIRERLCLASVVASQLPDQNWMSVSRTLKSICGNNKRPLDWFSQKNCALQYGYLVENLDTPKRKKRSSESGNNGSSPSYTETPTDSIIRRLTDERIQELKEQVRKDQEEYAKIQRDLKVLHSSVVTEQQLRDMWQEIQLQKEADRIEGAVLEKALREREQRCLDMQQSWRAAGNLPAVNVSQTENASVENADVDMDIEEIIDGNTPITPQTHQSSATSPLLSSLLKSPTTTSCPVSFATTQTGNSVARAPTITTLLTSGSIPNTNQPAIILNSCIPPEKAAQLLTRPISGPPTLPISVASVGQQILSPSQSAPTLSMLLEKNKLQGSRSNQLNNTSNVEIKDGEQAPIKQCDNSIKIDPSIKLDESRTNVSSTITDIDEHDSNDEQQLLEVFKNIGSIDELDIDVSDVINDEEVDFLKCVEEEPSAEESVEAEEMESKMKIPTNLANENQQISSNSKESNDTMPNDIKPTTEDLGLNKIPIKVECTNTKVETISSDDSNDNIPLAAVATLESKDHRLESLDTPLKTEKSEDLASLSPKQGILLKEKVESATQSIKSEEQTDVPPFIERISNKNLKNDAVEVAIENKLDAKCEEINALQKKEKQRRKSSKEGSENSDVILIPTDDDDESNQGKPSKCYEKAEEDENNTKDIGTSRLDESAIDTPFERPTSSQAHETSASECESITAPVPPSVISIADTDEDSSMTDISVSTRKDEKSSSHTSNKRNSSSTPSAHTRKSSSYDPGHTKSDEDNSNTNTVRTASKRSLLNIYNVLHGNKNAAIIQRALTDDSKSLLTQACKRPMDFLIIKRNIENNTIRSVVDLQRDLLLMTSHALMFFNSDGTVYKAAIALRQDMQGIREFIVNPLHTGMVKVDKETKDNGKNSSKTSRVGSRKSQRNVM